MYRLELIERLKQGPAAKIDSRPPVSPTVWKLGCTSLLTDISSEMVSSLLPVYLVLHLHMSPLQYGAIDGIYNGIAVVILSLTGGYLADRTRRYKEVAACGYGMSALCKLLLLVVGAVWGWIAAVIAIDRLGKGLRTAPRDALISLSTPAPFLAGAFAVHRALDAGGWRIARTDHRLRHFEPNADRVRRGLADQFRLRAAWSRSALAVRAESAGQPLRGIFQIFLARDDPRTR